MTRVVLVHDKLYIGASGLEVLREFESRINYSLVHGCEAQRFYE